MPIRLNAPTSNPPPQGQGLRLVSPNPSAPAVDAAGEQDSEFDPLTAMLAGGGLLAAGAIARKPGLASKGVKKLMDIRQQLMLSGLAIPKAILSNVGGAAIKSVETKSANPLRQLLSKQTLKDIGREYKSGAQSHVQSLGAQGGKAMHGPGRMLGAIDTATQNALRRAGISIDEAEAMTFQTPLGKSIGPGIGDALDSPAARYLIPFRRTPFNVFVQGWNTMKPQNLQTMTQKALIGGAGAAGAVHGAATADENFPSTLGLGAATANKYALPYLLAAAAGRSLAGGRNPESVGAESLPISEYGLASGVTEPLQTFTDPALVRVLRRLAGGNQ